MIYISEGWSVVFLLVYFVFVVYFFLNDFMGIYMEAYSIVRMQDGYDDNNNTWARLRCSCGSLIGCLMLLRERCLAIINILKGKRTIMMMMKMTQKLFRYRVRSKYW